MPTTTNYRLKMYLWYCTRFSKKKVSMSNRAVKEWEVGLTTGEEKNKRGGKGIMGDSENVG